MKLKKYGIDGRSHESKSKVIKVNRSFNLQGDVSGAIRSDAEMMSLDKALAESAFKAQKKRLGAFLKAKGFVKYKTNSYIRLNSIDVLEYFDIQKEHYGSKMLTANYALIPLYIQHKFLSFDLGGRLGRLICDRDVWWDYSNEAVAEESFRNIIRAIEEYLLPWFKERESVSALKQELMDEMSRREKYGGCLSDLQQRWLDSLDENMDCSDVVSNNMQVLKLPAKICKGLSNF